MMTGLHPQIILVTGNMAAGKSTIAQALAERFPRSVHLRGDLFRRMIVRGQVEMAFELLPEAARQLDLRYRVAAAAAELYVHEGFTVIYQDILIGAGLADAVARYRAYALAVVVLCPSPEAVAARDAERGKTAYPDREAILAFDRVLRTETPRIGYWIDTSNLTIAQAVDDILVHLPQALVKLESTEHDSTARTN